MSRIRDTRPHDAHRVSRIRDNRPLSVKATEQAFNYAPIDTNRLNVVARISGKKILT